MMDQRRPNARLARLKHMFKDEVVIHSVPHLAAFNSADIFRPKNDPRGLRIDGIMVVTIDPDEFLRFTAKQYRVSVSPGEVLERQLDVQWAFDIHKSPREPGIIVALGGTEALEMSLAQYVWVMFNKAQRTPQDSMFAPHYVAYIRDDENRIVAVNGYFKRPDALAVFTTPVDQLELAPHPRGTRFLYPHRPTGVPPSLGDKKISSPRTSSVRAA